MDRSQELRPMPLWMSLLCFGIPTGVGLLQMYLLLPALARAGVPLLWNYMVSMVSMFPLLLGAALLAVRLEGGSLSWDYLRRRWRIKGLSRREWAWTAGLVLVYAGGSIALMPSATWLTTVLPLPLPLGLPHALDPRVVKSTIPGDFFGIPLAGNWPIALLHLGILVLNVGSEELWWRGVVLPRQELVYGRWTWLLHGILWTLFHAPFWWNWISLLPATLSLSFVVSRLKNSTPGIIAHFVLNGLALVMTVLGVLGLGS